MASSASKFLDAAISSDEEISGVHVMVIAQAVDEDGESVGDPVTLFDDDIGTVPQGNSVMSVLYNDDIPVSWTTPSRVVLSATATRVSSPAVAATMTGQISISPEGFYLTAKVPGSSGNNITFYFTSGGPA